MDIETGWCRMIYSEYDRFLQDPHKHSFFEFHYMMAGELDFRIGDREFCVHSGEFIVVPPNVDHSTFFVAPSSEKFVFSFNVKAKCNFVEQALQKLQELTVYSAGVHFQPMIRMMMDYSFVYSDITKEVVSRMAECILIELFNLVSPAGNGDLENLAVFESDIRVSEINKFIEKNITDNISVSDIEAIAMLKNAWGTAEKRDLEEIEIIDIREEDEVVESWKDFIHTHHYSYHTDFFSSTLGKFPRRSCEATFDRLMNCRFLDGSKGFKKEMSFVDIVNKISPLLDEEEEKKFTGQILSKLY